VKELNAQFFANMILEQHLLSAVFAPSATFETDYERLELLGEVDPILLLFTMLIP
jgi:endoribonuclease Dicer